jgi:hypothetical protein
VKQGNTYRGVRWSSAQEYTPMAPICAAHGMFLSSANTYCTICILKVLNAVGPLEISLLVKIKESISALVPERFFFFALHNHGRTFVNVDILFPKIFLKLAI